MWNGGSCSLSKALLAAHVRIEKARSRKNWANETTGAGTDHFCRARCRHSDAAMRSIKFPVARCFPSVCRHGGKRLVLVVLLGAFVTLIARSLYLQGFDNEFSGRQGRARFERVIDISATRGSR